MFVLGVCWVGRLQCACSLDIDECLVYLGCVLVVVCLLFLVCEFCVVFEW